MGHWPERTDPVLNEVPREEAFQALRQRPEHYAATVATMPAHDAFLRRVLSAEPALQCTWIFTVIDFWSLTTIRSTYD